MMERRFTIVFCSALAAVAAFSTTPLTAAPTFTEGFEKVQIRAPGPYQTSGNKPVVTTERTRAGKYAMKVYLNRKSSATPNRTEMSVPSPQSAIGDDIWYGFSIFLPSSYVPS